ELSVCFSLSITNLSHSKFYLISLSHSSFQFLRQTRTYFGNLLFQKNLKNNRFFLVSLRHKEYNGDGIQVEILYTLDENILSTLNK
ncbi:hypothetical protein, partial [Streptococcus suis]|uniref:hypothetical protein n=1 Tax=Streptococcus suis TaxID=1307 RepID=UPI00211CE579